MWTLHIIIISCVVSEASCIVAFVSLCIWICITDRALDLGSSGYVVCWMTLFRPCRFQDWPCLFCIHMERLVRSVNNPLPSQCKNFILITNRKHLLLQLMLWIMRLISLCILICIDRSKFLILEPSYHKGPKIHNMYNDVWVDILRPPCGSAHLPIWDMEDRKSVV